MLEQARPGSREGFVAALKKLTKKIIKKILNKLVLIK